SADVARRVDGPDAPVVGAVVERRWLDEGPPGDRRVFGFDRGEPGIIRDLDVVGYRAGDAAPGVERGGVRRAGAVRRVDEHGCRRRRGVDLHAPDGAPRTGHVVVIHSLDAPEVDAVGQRGRCMRGSRQAFYIDLRAVE